MSNVVFTPQKIGNIVSKNRIFCPAHQMFLCPDGRVSERFLHYLEARAAGGAGLIIVESSPVHTSSSGSPKQLVIWDDEAIEGIARIKDRLAPYNTRVVLQLFHGGNQYRPLDGSPPWSASATVAGTVGTPAVAMTKAMIDEIVESFALGARRCATAGLDGVEVHAAHGVLPCQFLSKALNFRDDEYGGPFENRMRFFLEVMRGVRSAVPETVAVGARLGPGIYEESWEENARAMAALEAEQLVDFFDLSVGDSVALDIISSGMNEPSGYELPYFKSLEERTSVPLLVTGRFRTIDEAGTVIRGGQAAMVGMARAIIADPDLVRKSEEGRAEEVRPCIGCNQRCVAGVPLGNSGCAINPEAGFERQFDLGPVAGPRKVHVIGGGVAGMEAARVAALRGHSVTLHEAQPDLGGKVRFTAQRAPKMSSFGDVTFWQESELRRMGVEICTNSYVEASDLAMDGADIVIIATGAVPREHRFQRHRPGHVIDNINLPHVITSVDLLATPAERYAGKKAVVVDDVGHYEAIAAAEYLVEAGAEVTFATRFGAFGPLLDFTFRNDPAFRRMHRTGRFTLRTHAMIDRIDEASVTLFDPSMDFEPEVIAAEVVVFVSHNEPYNELATELGGPSDRVIVIGDALSPRYIESAISEGFHAGLKA